MTLDDAMLFVLFWIVACGGFVLGCAAEEAWGWWLRRRRNEERVR